MSCPTLALTTGPDVLSARTSSAHSRPGQYTRGRIRWSASRCAQRPDVPCCHGVPGAHLGGGWLGGLGRARSRSPGKDVVVDLSVEPHTISEFRRWCRCRQRVYSWLPVAEPLGRSGHAFRTGAVPESSGCCIVSPPSPGASLGGAGLTYTEIRRMHHIIGSVWETHERRMGRIYGPSPARSRDTIFKGTADCCCAHCGSGSVEHANPSWLFSWEATIATFTTITSLTSYFP